MRFAIFLALFVIGAECTFNVHSLFPGLASRGLPALVRNRRTVLPITTFGLVHRTAVVPVPAVVGVVHHSPAVVPVVPHVVGVVHHSPAAVLPVHGLVGVVHHSPAAALVLSRKRRTLPLNWFGLASHGLSQAAILTRHRRTVPLTAHHAAALLTHQRLLPIGRVGIVYG